MGRSYSSACFYGRMVRRCLDSSLLSLAESRLNFRRRYNLEKECNPNILVCKLDLLIGIGIKLHPTESLSALPHFTLKRES